MRKAVLLFVSMASAVMLACGVALATEIACPTGENGRCTGTSQDDTLIGTEDFDKMKGFAGNDTFYGNGSRDFVVGHVGNDTLRGGVGSDVLVGATQFLDYVAPDRDRLLGGPNDDTLIGGAGNDRVSGGPGEDTVRGRVYGSSAAYSNIDYVRGDNGDDTIDGDDGELYGDEGEDYIVARGADVLLDGGPGNDQIRPAPCEDNSAQEAIGGPGEDFLGTFPGLCENASAQRTITIRAVDDEHDTIACHEAVREIVRVDHLDTFKESPPKLGRRHCDSTTLVK